MDLRPRSLAAPVVVWLMMLLAVACSSSSGNSEAQPQQGGDFVHGAFDDIPRHPGSEPLQSPEESGDVVTGSFVVETAQPRTVLEFYDGTLDADGWANTEAPAEVGRDIWRGEWLREGDRLEVSASPADQIEGGAFENPTQYSLVLHTS